MENVCYGCFKTISIEERKNLFDDNLLISVYDYTESDKSGGYLRKLKLSDGIELITGLKVPSTYDRLINYCDVCFRNMELYLNLRSRLLYSFRLLNDNLLPRIELAKIYQANEEHRLPESADLITEKAVNKNIRKENINFQVSNCEAAGPINSTESTVEMQNDPENVVLNVFENSNESSNHSSNVEAISNIQDNDIESEVDVFAGEDDKVVELNKQYRKDDNVDSNASSESDSEVCDYEPMKKKIKGYVALSHLFS